SSWRDDHLVVQGERHRHTLPDRSRSRQGPARRYWTPTSTQDPMSNSMKASTFSWGSISPTSELQPSDGNAAPLPDESPDATWMSEKTTRPHRSDSPASNGVVNEKYWTEGSSLLVTSW